MVGDEVAEFNGGVIGCGVGQFYSGDGGCYFAYAKFQEV